jgi:hypothetical protein
MENLKKLALATVMGVGIITTLGIFAMLVKAIILALEA